VHPLTIVVPAGAFHPERDGKRSGGTCCFFRATTIPKMSLSALLFAKPTAVEQSRTSSLC
jgi:hypothetical protein